MKKAIVILGAGAWGTALAYFFGSKGHTVYLWCYEQEVADSITNNHVNALFLSDACLPDTVYASTDIQYILSFAVDFVIEAIPVTYLRAVLGLIDCKKALNVCWVLTSKGLERQTGCDSLQIIEQLFGEKVNAIVLAGPSFALELMQGMPTACVLAAKEPAMYNVFATYWQSPYTALYYTNDLKGVLLCGALKNIVSLLLGLLEGAGYGKNTQSFFLTIAYQEMKKVVNFFGGQQNTVDGLAGFGDLFLTASSNISKNRTYGYLVGQKNNFDQIHKQIPVLPEGVSTAVGFYTLVPASLSNDLTLLCAVNDILTGKISVKEMVVTYFTQNMLLE